VAVVQNREFFAGEHWSQQVAEIDSYSLVSDVVDAELAGTRRLLDVGNGGVCGYTTESIESIVAVDLFLERVSIDRFPENVEPREGDALALDEPDDSYDTVLHSFLYHHLVGTTASALIENTDRAIAEAERVLKPGGKLIVTEGCVPRWFYAFERAAFPALLQISKTPLLGGHPATILFPFEDVVSLVGRRLNVERAEELPAGRWTTMFGRRWPHALAPFRQFLIVATKPE
jgi:SAM-dependent methyltransferase